MVIEPFALLAFFAPNGILNVLLPLLFAFGLLCFAFMKSALFTQEENTHKGIVFMAAFFLSFLLVAATSHIKDPLLYLQLLGMALVSAMSLIFLLATLFHKTFFEKKTTLYVLGFIFTTLAFVYSLGLWNSAEGAFLIDLLFNPITILVVVFYTLLMFITGEGPMRKEVKEKIVNVKKN